MHEVNTLVKISEDLRNSTSGFKTQLSVEMMLDTSKTDHRVFVGKISACLKGDISIDPASLPTHHTCRFGKWYDTEGTTKCGSFASFKSVERPHERIHALAKEAVSSLRAGNKQKAWDTYREIENLSEEVGSLIDGIKRECS